jgi:predicted LPLAT superfamily acyltransferase
VTGWTGQRERGSGLALRLITRIALTLGWRPAQALLYPITAFYLATSPRAQRMAARAYLGRALGRKAGMGDLWRLWFAFACTMLDRVFLLSGRTQGYAIDIVGTEAVEARIAAGRGCLLFGAHLGSFEALRAVAGRLSPVEVHALMYEATGRIADALFNALDPAREAAVIPLGRADTMLRTAEALDRGGLVGLLADRAPAGQRMALVPFLGQPAPFPSGPYALAGVLGAPVMLCFGIWRGPRSYELRFEPFADRVVLDRADRAGALALWAGRYAARLEALARAHPYNWFNFYDFWDEAPGTAAP